MSADETPYAGIDRLVHEPARLHILTILSLVESMDFLFLLRQTGLTKGNLSSHLNKLEASQYVDIEKEFVEKLPHTVVKITTRGRDALQTYRQQMTGVLKKLPKEKRQENSQTAPGLASPDFPPPDTYTRRRPRKPRTE